MQPNEPLQTPLPAARLGRAPLEVAARYPPARTVLLLERDRSHQVIGDRVIVRIHALCRED